MRRERDGDSEQILADGEKLKIPMVFMDGKPVGTVAALCDAASGFRQSRIVDGFGNAPGRRPGFVYATDEGVKIVKQLAYADYQRDLVSAANREGPEGSVCTVRNEQYPYKNGAPGHIKGGVCVPDDQQTDAEPPATQPLRKKQKRDPQGRESGSEEYEYEEDASTVRKSVWVDENGEAVSWARILRAARAFNKAAGEPDQDELEDLVEASTTSTESDLRRDVPDHKTIGDARDATYKEYDEILANSWRRGG